MDVSVTEVNLNNVSFDSSFEWDCHLVTHCKVLMQLFLEENASVQWSRGQHPVAFRFQIVGASC